jgi:aminoglycoside 2'-N-acetyltransferase I
MLYHERRFNHLRLGEACEVTTMTVELRVSDAMTPEEYQRLFCWGEAIFGPHDGLYQWRPKTRHIYVEEDGQVVGHVGLLEETVRAGDEEVRVCGVGGVVTRPEAQKRGLARQAMRRAAQLMRDETDAEFGMLYCRDELIPFYDALGWQLVADENEFGQPTGPVRSAFNVMVLPLRARQWPAGRVVVAGLPW